MSQQQFNQGAISSTTQYDKVFKSNGVKCMVIILSVIMVVDFGVQVGLLLSGNDGLV